VLASTVLPKDFTPALTCVLTYAYLFYLANAQKGTAILKPDWHIFGGKYATKSFNFRNTD